MVTHPLRRSTRIALLVVSAALLALVLNQCRMVEDQITAPARVENLGQHPDNHGNCISECAKAYADSNQVESKLHEVNLAACGNDPACSDTENARYEAVKARIAEGRKACFDDCHHQGGGSGGR